MALAEELRQLRKQRCEGGCLTIYLNTDQSIRNQKKGEWKIRLKNGLKKLEEYIAASNKEELAAYKKLKKQAAREILELQTSLPRSIVFLGSADGKWQLKRLHVSVENEFRWEKHPALEQLEHIQKAFPKVGVLVVQKLDVIAIETSLGKVERELSYTWDIDDEDWKEYEGTAASERMASGATHVDQFEQRLDANQQRWFKNLAQRIQQIAKQSGWHTIYLTGSAEAISEFKKHLTYRKVTVIKKNFTKFKSHEIITEVVLAS